MLPAKTPLYFVISDLIPVEARTLHTSTLEIARDARAAVGSSVEIRVVRESKLQSDLSPIFRELLSGTTFGGIVDVHPKRTRLRAGEYRGPLQDFLFPIYQGAYLIGLDCETACYNDDNSRFVDFARRMRRRLDGGRAGLDPAHPTLRLRSPGRLLGHDGRKMSKSNQNALMLSASSADVSKFAARLVGRSSEGRASFDAEGVSDLESVYIAAFSTDAATAAAVVGVGRIDSLAKTLSTYLAEVGGRRLAKARSDSEEVAAMEADEQSARQTIREVIAGLAL